MRKYVELVQKYGLDAALKEFQIEMIELFRKKNITQTARALQIERTTFFWRIQKLNLSHLFKKEMEDSNGKESNENQKDHKKEN